MNINAKAFSILRDVIDDMIRVINSPRPLGFDPRWSGRWEVKALEQHYIGGFSRESLFNKFGVHVFNGEYKIVVTHDLWDFVLKIARYDWDPIRKDKHDETDDEYQIYRQAVAAGVGYAFAEMAPFMTLPNGHRIYLQKKISNTWGKAHDEIMEHCGGHEMYKLFRRGYGLDSALTGLEYDRSLDPRFLFFFADTYGIDELDKLIKFITENEIYDLHDENIGISMNGMPIIFDYAGEASYTK